MCWTKCLSAGSACHAVIIYGPCFIVFCVYFVFRDTARAQFAKQLLLFIDLINQVYSMYLGFISVRRNTRTLNSVFRRHHSEKRFCLSVSMLLFRGLSVCHVHASCSNSRYWHDFFSIWQPHQLTQIVLKCGLYRSAPSSSNFAETFDGKLWPNSYR